MFEKFPKVRPLLPREIEEIYTAQYKSNREGETKALSLVQGMESWLYRDICNLSEVAGRYWRKMA